MVGKVERLCKDEVTVRNEGLKLSFAWIGGERGFELPAAALCSWSTLEQEYRMPNPVLTS